MFSHNGQIHPDAVSFDCSQIDLKLRLVDGQVTAAKRKSIWKLWKRYISAAINRAVSRIQREITMVNASNSAQRQATSTTCNDAFSSASKVAEELEQNFDVLLLDQDVCQSQYAGSQLFEDVMSEQQVYFVHLI